MQDAQDIVDHCSTGTVGCGHQPGPGRSDACRHERYARPKEAGKAEAKAEANAPDGTSAALRTRPRRAQDGASAFTVANAITVSSSNADEIGRLLLNTWDSAMDCCGNDKKNGDVAPGSKRRARWGKQTYRHAEAVTVDVDADPGTLFEHLDDQERLASHMMQSSAMMAGSSMNFAFDQGRGQTLGSRIGMSGKVLGIALEMSEIVIERDPPRRKVWQTEGEPRLLVIGAYRMGFDIAPESIGSRLRVFIEYDLPAWPWRLVGLIAARFYARWCVKRMANDAALGFAD